MFVGLDARERALVLGAVTRGDTDETLRELAVEDLDWNAILMASLWHKVAFLVYRRLAATSGLDLALTEGNLPLILLNHWKQLTKVNEVRSRLYADAARTVCAAATECGADLAVAKGGPILFGDVYTPAERKTYDLDFLARRSELEFVEAALQRAGFQYGEYRHATEELLEAREGDRRKHLLQGRGLPNFLLKPKSKMIDYLVAQVRFRVGASTADGMSVPADRLLERAEDRGGMRVVCWTDLALQLALHLYREAHETEYQRWNLDWNLIKLCDFDRVMHLPQISIAAVMDRVAELGFTREFGFAAHITDMMLPSGQFAEIAERCGDEAQWYAERYDRKTVERLIWSVGTALNRQASPWTTIVGAKTS